MSKDGFFLLLSLGLTLFLGSLLMGIYNVDIPIHYISGIAIFTLIFSYAGLAYAILRKGVIKNDYFNAQSVAGVVRYFLIFASIPVAVFTGYKVFSSGATAEDMSISINSATVGSLAFMILSSIITNDKGE